MVNVETNLFLSFKFCKLYKDKCRACGDHNMLCGGGGEQTKKLS